MSLRLISLSVLALVLAAAPARAQDPPDKREVDELVTEYFALDWKRPQDIERQREIHARLAELPALDKKKAKDWRKKLLKLWEKGPELPTKSGKHYLWEEEERGMFIIGGKTRKAKALFLGMHGGGVGSGDAWSTHSSYNGAVSSEKWLGIYPEVLEKTECGWTDSGTEEFVIELIERARRTFGVDPDRVILGGHSMGGYGSWTLGAHHADMCAALVPSAGAPTPIYRGDSIVAIAKGVVPNLRNVAMLIFQSTDDERVPPEPNQFAVKLLEAAKERHGGYDFEYWEVDDRGHGFPNGGAGALLEKVSDRVRNPYPEKIVWQPVLSWKRQFYWLFWDEPQINAQLVADLDREKNEVRVSSTARLAKLSLLVNDDLIDRDRELVVTVNDTEVFRGVPAYDLATLVRTGRHGDPKRTFDGVVPLAP